MNRIEFYLAFKLKEAEEYHLPAVTNEIRKCLFDEKIIESGTQFKIYTDVEQYPLQKKVLRVRFLCRIQTESQPAAEELECLLQPAFAVLAEKKGLTEFSIKYN